MAQPKSRLAFDRTLFRAGERVCCAVSGGADSTALLLALAEANAERDAQGVGLGLVISAAHVNHGLRGEEADGDAAFVGELCARHAVPLTVFRVDTPARQAKTGEGLEEAARELRYTALRGLIQSGAVDTIATAHTLDDQAETVIMKLLRGAWTEGLGGISPVVLEDAPQSLPRGAQERFQPSSPQPASESGGKAPPGRIVRPLLEVRRAEVEAFLAEREQGWREDASNGDLRLTRNRVRHELMPLLRGFNPGIDHLLARTSGIARDEEAYWQAEIRRILPQVLLPGRPVRGGGRAVGTTPGEASCAIELARLAAMPAALRRRIVRAAARSVGQPGGLSAEETAGVLALAGLPSDSVSVSGDEAGRSAGAGAARRAVPSRVGSRLELRGGLRVERSARELRFWREMSL